MTDEMLELLGNHFVANKLHEKGWEFHEFVEEVKIGTVTINA